MVAVLLMAGVHEPEMPLLEVVGSVNEPPEQMGATCVKVGTVGAGPAGMITVVVAMQVAPSVRVML